MTTQYSIELHVPEMYLDVKIQHSTGIYYKVFHYFKGRDSFVFSDWYNMDPDIIVFKPLEQCKNAIYDEKRSI